MLLLMLGIFILFNLFYLIFVMRRFDEDMPGEHRVLSPVADSAA